MRASIFIFLFIAFGANAQEQGFIPYKQNKKWIVLNDSCQIISKDKYDTVCLMVGGLAKVKQKNKWGYVNIKGETVIPIIYDEIGEFDGNGFARVRKKHMWGYSNNKNEVVVPLIYDSIGFYNTYAKYHYAKVKMHDSTYYIDRKGKWINPEQVGAFGVCGTGHGFFESFMARVIKNKNGLFGLFSEGKGTGNDTLLPCEYKQILYVSESSFAILQKEKYSLYNTGKEKMILTDCDTISFYEENVNAYWVLYKKNKTTGIIHPYGYQQTEIDYKFIKIITGYFIYITDSENHSYYIDYKGKKFIPK